MAALGLGIVILISRRKELGLKMSDHRPKIINSVQFSSLAQSCPTLCNPMDCSTPGLEVLKRNGYYLEVVDYEIAVFKI